MVAHSSEMMNGSIPPPYRAVIIISCDFELAWAWRYAKAFENPVNEALKMARISRKNIFRILELCDQAEIPITWATVGHLMLERCKGNGNLAHNALRRIPYHENEYWRFNQGDWFDEDPCTNAQLSPEWYAPDIIKMILNARTKHEIACHTFSHIDCSETICSKEVFEDELKECIKVAKDWGIAMKSFVYPGNFIGNLKTLKESGFKSYRTDYGNFLALPARNQYGLWELQGTAELTYRKEWSMNYHVWRYKKIVDRAIQRRRLCNLWFHPSCNEKVIELIFPPLFEYINSLKNKGLLLITTMKDYTALLEYNNDNA